MTTLRSTEPRADVATELDLYRRMLMIRSFEERVVDLYSRALIPGITHVSIGQEAVAVGVCASLERSDWITSTHRGHGHCLAKGAQPGRMFAELLGKQDGYCGGRGGSMHIADTTTGNLGANAIVGGSLAIATGAAFAAARTATGAVAACFFGDGAVNEGLFAEALNMAAVWRLPVVYVCEDNQYGEYTSSAAVTAGPITARGEAVGVASPMVDGMDVLAVREAAMDAIRRARAGEGPTLLVCRTYRFLGHGMSDPTRPYRTRDEEQDWRRRDPIERLAGTLRAAGAAEADLEGIAAGIDAELEAAVVFAHASPFPSTDTVAAHVHDD